VAAAGGDDVTSFLNWASNLPKHWVAKPLRAVADYTVSNVDKVPAANEAPVRLCNYTDVYNNEFITLDLDFMRATATEVEIEKFGLKVDDVVITKDSESWDDIGVPAIVKETAGDLVCGYHLAVLRPHKQILVLQRGFDMWCHTAPEP
jgi:type I restriction enzyme S subunit